MSTESATTAADATRAARADFVRDSLKTERWSIRQAALAMGMSHTALASRLRSETSFLADEIESIAHLLRHEPVDYFRLYLQAGTTKAPTPEGEGRKLPGLGSNQEPIG
jgi:hypothetical protein